MELRSVDLSVPFRDAKTVKRRSFSRVSRSEHFSRSGALPLPVLGALLFFALELPLSRLIGSCPHLWSWSVPHSNSYRPRGTGVLEQKRLDTEVPRSTHPGIFK